MALVDEQLKKKKLVSRIARKSQPNALITIGTPSPKIDIRIEGDLFFLAGKVVMRRRWIRVGGVPPEGLTGGLVHISRSVVPSRGDNLNQRGYIIAWRHVITSWATAFQNPLIYSSHLVLALSRSSLLTSSLHPHDYANPPGGKFEGIPSNSDRPFYLFPFSFRYFRKFILYILHNFGIDKILWLIFLNISYRTYKRNILCYVCIIYLHVILPNLIVPIKSNITTINRNGVTVNPPTCERRNETFVNFKISPFSRCKKRFYIPFMEFWVTRFVNCARYFAGIRATTILE